ncbi:MAG: ATP-binding protein [Actinomycetota bacterium]|nr:ATP-binding protein [Actinomycetota bacterium]
MERIVPSAARTVASLRDIGYDTPHAIADLVDNSLAAGASRVDVTITFDGTSSWIRIADNGEGMDAATLLEAMRYGSERNYEKDDLGKFGFGLKTASTSQCRRLTVASRRSAQRARLEVRCLDLDHIESTNEWEVIILDGADRPEKVTQPLRDHPGTVVLWEDLDRVLAYKDPWGEWARRRLLALAEEVDLHLGMVFHRFLAGEVPGRKLRMTLNGALIEPWDPFCRGEKRTEELPAKDLVVARGEGVGIVRARPYVLPRQNEFSSDTAWRRASGPNNWNRQQGFYIYRAHRMIQSGGWNRIRTPDEHTKMARIALDFFPDLDAVFGINIAKAYVTLPAELREQLDPLVSQVTRRADQRYRTGDARGTGGPGGSGGSTGGRGGGRRGGQGTASAGGGDGRSPGLGVRTRRAIEDAAASAGEKQALERIIAALTERSPEVARDLGW